MLMLYLIGTTGVAEATAFDVDDSVTCAIIRHDEVDGR